MSAPHSLLHLTLPLLVFLSPLSNFLTTAREYSSTDKATILGCNIYSDCNGHGTCASLTGTCDCDRGYGSLEESAWMKYRVSYDCSLRTCPFGRAWGGVPQNNGTEVSTDGISGNTDTAHPMAECSDMGDCDREMGECVCREGFRGVACEYSFCPGEGGKGTCR